METASVYNLKTPQPPPSGVVETAFGVVSLEKKFYVYKVYKQFGSRSGLKECQAYSVKAGQVPNCLLLSSPIVLVIVLLSISARARANIQFTEELGHSIFKQKFSQVFVFLFLLFVVVFYFIKISTPWCNAHASMGEASTLDK